MTLKWTAAVALAGVLAAQPGSAETPVLATDEAKASYSVGVSMGMSVRQQKLELDAELVLRGLRDGLAGGPLLLSEEEVGRIVSELQAELRQRQLEARRLGGEEHKKKGETFLAANGTKPGVVALPSGLQYRVVQEGAGKTPTDTDTVEVRYRGTLLDGTEFDSSFTQGKPRAFRVNTVIAGWNEALKRMPVGSRWQLFVPPQLAYGGRGAGRAIPPFATLVFDVELVAIQ